MKPYFEQKGITLYHGDCRAILSDLPAEQFDMIITDPPYLVGYDGRNHPGTYKSQGGESAFDWDACPDPAYVRHLINVFDEVWRVLKDDALCCTFYGWPHADIFCQHGSKLASGLLACSFL